MTTTNSATASATTTFRSLCDTRAKFSGLVSQFTQHVWITGWRNGKVAEQQKFGVFLGRPPVGQAVKMADGSVKVLDVHSRIRLQQIDPDQLAELGISQDKVDALPSNKKNCDVWHPEYVGTFDELVALSDPMHNYYANNAVGATSVLNYLAQYVADDSTTIGEMIGRIEALLNGSDQETARAMNVFVHGVWMGRAVMDLSCLANDDYVPAFALTKVSAEIDEWVAKPVLAALIEYLRTLNQE